MKQGYANGSISVLSGAVLRVHHLSAHRIEQFFHDLYRDNRDQFLKYDTAFPQLSLTPDYSAIVSRLENKHFHGYKVWTISGFDTSRIDPRWVEWMYEDRPAHISRVGQCSLRESGSMSRGIWCNELIAFLDTLTV